MATTVPASATSAPELTEKKIPGPARVLSVDVLRGLTIAFMILVNDPGDWEHVFPPLDHAPWNGWTLTDLVFPTFLFLIGASIIFSLDARTRKGDCRKTLSGHVILRCLKILLLQYILVFFPYMHYHTMRLYGVLPRIALCYLLAGLILIATSKLKSRVPVLIAIVATLLIGYWALLRFVPVPGAVLSASGIASAGLPGRDIPFMDSTQNLTSWLDRAAMAFTQRWLHTGRLYLAARDPEGLLSTLPAVASTLLGALTGLWMRQTHGPRGSIALRNMQLRLGLAGILGVVAGTAWSPWFPINKNLWTSSYVLLAAGWAALALALLSLLVDRRPEPWPRWLRISTWPWFVFGSNAIAAFTVSVIVVKTGLYFKHTNTVTGIKTSLWGLYYQHVFARHGSTNWTSLAFALSIVLICFLPNLFLWRRKIFLKI
jgi:predicted acyltransferase